MGPWDAFTQGFNQSFGAANENRMKKKMMEQELQNRMALAKYQTDLENQTLTPEQKLMQMYKSDPQGFTSTMQGFKSAMDPSLATDIAAKQQAMNNANYQQQLDYWKLRYGPQWNAQNGVSDKTQQYNWLMGMPGMSREQALRYLYRPPFSLDLFGGAGGAAGGGM